MGTPYVHCMSQLPTAHEPADRATGPLEDPLRSRGHVEGAVPREGHVTKSGSEVSHQYR
jgi:hypothetical protein